MTAQASETLLYEDKEFSLKAEPLEQFLTSKNIEIKQPFTNSSCWRGYVGTWEIKNDKLFLVDIDTEGLVFVQNGKEIGWSDLFGTQKEIFAEWFSCEIKIQYGDALYSGKYEPIICEEDLFLKFNNGQLIGKRKIDYKSLLKEMPDVGILGRSVGILQMLDDEITVENIRGIYFR